MLGTTATLEFRLVDDQNDPVEAERTEARAARLEALQHARRRRRCCSSARSSPPATSSPMRPPSSAEGQPAVVRQARRARRRARCSRPRATNLGRPMAVVFIEKKRLTEARAVPEACVRAPNAPKRRSSASRRSRACSAAISRSPACMAGEARELALLLRAGSLAAPMYIVEQRTIGPSLGQDNIDRGVRALVIGMLAAFVFMVDLLPGVRRGRQRWCCSSNVVLLVGAAVDAAGVAVAARHRRHRAHGRHGGRRERPDLRAHPRGAAQRHSRRMAAINAGFDKAFCDHRRLERHHPDRGRGAVRVRHRPDQGLRHRAVARHPHVDVHGAAGQPRADPPRSGVGGASSSACRSEDRYRPWNSSTRKPTPVHGRRGAVVHACPAS